MIDLYRTGEGRLGKLAVKPSAGCRAYQPPAAKIHPVDWIAMASLRDSENTVFDYSSADDTAAGITMPHSLAAWFSKLGWRGVRNNTNVFFVKGRDEVKECACDFDVQRWVCLFINMQMLYPNKFANRSVTLNHWVGLTKQMIVQRDTIKFGVYTWSGLPDIPRTGSYPLGGFYRNFYGYVSATPTYGLWGRARKRRAKRNRSRSQAEFRLAAPSRLATKAPRHDPYAAFLRAVSARKRGISIASAATTLGLARMRSR